MAQPTIKLVYTDATGKKFTEDRDITGSDNPDVRKQIIARCLDSIEFRVAHKVRFDPVDSLYKVTLSDGVTVIKISEEQLTQYKAGQIILALSTVDEWKSRGQPQT